MWQIEDEQAKNVVVDLFTGIKNGLDYSSALQKAKTDLLLKDYPISAMSWRHYFSLLLWGR